MTKNANRFSNRSTTVKGFIINTETQEFQPFETVVSYVRSADKAVNMVREQMGINEAEIIVTVNEIVNEAPKPVKYNDGKIYDLAYNCFDTEAEARSAAEIDGAEMRVITWYEISGQIWALYDEDYMTEFYADETPANLTKSNAREFLKMSYEDMSGSKVLGVHNCTKREKPMYCIITRENLQKCIEV